MLKMSIYGDFLLVGNTQPSLHVRVSSLDLLSLDHMRGSGRPGNRPNAIFFLWLVGHNWCWMADRLACHGLPYPRECPLYDQEDETINHLLASYVFARQFWYLLLRQASFHPLSPQPSDTSFVSRWEKASGATSGLIQKGLNFLIVLGAWTLWNHQNHCIFIALPLTLVVLHPCWRRAPVVEFRRSQGSVFLDSPSFWWLI